MMRVPVPSLESKPGPETVPVKVWSQAPTSRLPPPAPRMRLRWKKYPPDSDRIWPLSSLIASTAPLVLVSLPNSPWVGVTVPEVWTMALSWIVRLMASEGSVLPKGLTLAFLSVPRMSRPGEPPELMTRSEPGPPWREPYQVSTFPWVSMRASPRLVAALVLILVRRLMSSSKEAPAWRVDWLSWMSVMLLRAVSGSAAPRLRSALRRRVPPPSIRHPPAELVAVLTLLELDRMSVPAPSFTIVFVPAIVELSVTATPESTLKLDGVPIIVSV